MRSRRRIGVCRGGIYLIRSGGFVTDSIVIGAQKFGIAAVESDLVSKAPLLTGNHIDSTQASAAGFGVGIGASLSTIHVFETESSFTDGPGVANWWSDVTLGDSHFACNAFDFFVESDQTFGPSQYFDAGGNGCGCPNPIGACVAQSVGLVPPEFSDP